MTSPIIKAFLEALSHVSTGLSLAAFAIVAVLTIVLATQRTRRVSPLAYLGLILVAVLSLSPIAADAWLKHARQLGAYHVRVTVLNSQGTPTDDAHVWSDRGGEAAKVAGGWEFVIPAGPLTNNATLTIYAEVASDFLAGNTQVALSSDLNPAVTIRLTHDTTAVVRGSVQDQDGRAVPEVQVWVEGYNNESVKTGSTGGFELAAHAARGEQVLLHAEKVGYNPVSMRQPAGQGPVLLQLRAVRRGGG
jgi:hypothetical protein